jgi:hypothetical protein
MLDQLVGNGMRLNGTGTLEIPVNTRIVREWVEIVQVTPDMAKQWLEEWHYEGNRRERPVHTEFLAAEIKAGRFRTSEMRVVHYNGKTFKTNGEHRCRAVVLADMPINVCLYHCEVTDREEVGLDYGVADTQMKRTVLDGVQATGIMDNSGLSATRANCFISALKPIVGGFSGTAYSGSTVLAKSLGIKLNAVRYWLDTAHELYNDLAGADNKITGRIERQAVLSVALVTRKFQPEKASEFWRAVAANDGLTKGDPRRELVKFLMNNPAKKRGYPWHSRVVAQAWNHHFHNRQCYLLRVNKVTDPILIEGTPYDGTRVIVNTFDSIEDSYE